MTRKEELKMLDAQLSDNQEEAWDIIRDRLIDDGGWILVKSNSTEEAFRKYIDGDEEVDVDEKEYIEISFDGYWVCISIAQYLIENLRMCSRATEIKIGSILD